MAPPVFGSIKEIASAMPWLLIPFTSELAGCGFFVLQGCEKMAGKLASAGILNLDLHWPAISAADRFYIGLSNLRGDFAEQIHLVQILGAGTQDK